MKASGILFFALLSVTFVADGQVFREVDISQYIKFLVDEHNKYRSSVEPPAANMKEMGWDHELAAIAQTHANVCEFKHDTNFSTSLFDKVGENIYFGNMNVQTTVMLAVDKWYNDEVANFNFDLNVCEVGECGHYTQVVWATTYKVGCALTLCARVTGLGIRGLMFNCYYGPPGNQQLKMHDGTSIPLSPYIAGPPCSACDADEECDVGLKLCVRSSDVGLKETPEETSPASVETTTYQPTTTQEKTTRPSTTMKSTTISTQTPTSSTARPTVTQPPPISSCPDDKAKQYLADYKRWQKSMERWKKVMDKYENGLC